MFMPAPHEPVEADFASGNTSWHACARKKLSRATTFTLAAAPCADLSSQHDHKREPSTLPLAFHKPRGSHLARLPPRPLPDLAGQDHSWKLKAV
jgi:hypothetical protein